MALLSKRDLLKKWTRPPIGRGIYTRQGVYKVFHFADFPAPAVTDGAGLTGLWNPADIDAFEAAHPELTSEDAKHNKVKRAGYAARLGRQQQA